MLRRLCSSEKVRMISLVRVNRIGRMTMVRALIPNVQHRTYIPTRINKNIEIKSATREEPSWIQGLRVKQSAQRISEEFEYSSGIQQFMTCLTQPDGLSKLSKTQVTETRGIENLIVLLLHVILKSQIPGYTNASVEACISTLMKETDASPGGELYVSEEIQMGTVFGVDGVRNILADVDFQNIVAILKRRLCEKNGWRSNVECRDDNIIVWMNSLFEGRLNRCLMQVGKSKYVPDIVLYDLLLRKVENEIEAKYFFEFYKMYSTELNLLDQEKLFYLKKGNEIREDGINRKLKLPPLFDNLFRLALREEVRMLPELVDLFLNENNISSPNTLEQIGEMIWFLSWDHTGEFMGKPSRYYMIAQSKLIKAVNEMTEKNKELEIDVTTMLGVSNLTFYKDYRKAFKMFKNAKRQFDDWQLNAFKPDEFKKIGGKTKNILAAGKVSDAVLNDMKVDYNIKFLCNSIIMLAVNPENKELIVTDLKNIFNKIEPKMLAKYPEIWEFVVIKLNYHKLTNEHLINNLFTEYLRIQQNYGINSYFVLDYIINNCTTMKTLNSMIVNFGITNFDDNNTAHLISKYYKLANQKKDTEALTRARKIYEESKFKSSRINSSYLLGESIFSPQDTFKRYNGINSHFKTTQLSISSLFVSVFKLHESGEYEGMEWGGKAPLDFALGEFDKHVCKAYGDTSEGMIYPNDNLLLIYMKVLRVFQKDDALYALMDRLVDLKYPVGITLFNEYLQCLRSSDSEELIRCLNAYDAKFNKLLECKNEFELRRLKARLVEVKAVGKFEKFVQKLEFNWDVIRRWKWPGRNL